MNMIFPAAMNRVVKYGEDHRKYYRTSFGSVEVKYWRHEINGNGSKPQGFL
jgi:hypothetical protein